MNPLTDSPENILISALRDQGWTRVYVDIDVARDDTVVTVERSGYRVQARIPRVEMRMSRDPMRFIYRAVAELNLAWEDHEREQRLSGAFTSVRRFSSGGFVPQTPSRQDTVPVVLAKAEVVPQPPQAIERGRKIRIRRRDVE